MTVRSGGTLQTTCIEGQKTIVMGSNVLCTAMVNTTQWLIDAMISGLHQGFIARDCMYKQLENHSVGMQCALDCHSWHY